MAGANPSDPFDRIDSLVETISNAHLAIFTLHRRVVERRGPNREARPLLDESIAITFTEAPTAADAAREVAIRLAVGELVSEPSEGGSYALTEALDRAVLQLAELLRRQEVIAAKLAALAAAD